MWGAGVVQDVDVPTAMQIFVGYCHYELDVTIDNGTVQGNPDDMDIIQAGARVRF